MRRSRHIFFRRAPDEERLACGTDVDRPIHPSAVHRQRSFIAEDVGVVIRDHQEEQEAAGADSVSGPIPQTSQQQSHGQNERQLIQVDDACRVANDVETGMCRKNASQIEKSLISRGMTKTTSEIAAAHRT